MKKCTFVLVAAIIAAAAVSVVTPAMAKKEKPIVIKYSTWANDGEPAYEGMKKFKEIVEANSNGSIVVDLFPSDQAGSTSEQVEQVSMNQLQMMSSGDAGIPELEYLALPYLMRSPDQYIKVLSSELGQKFTQKVIDMRNCRIIDTLPRSPRIISSNIKIEKLADMKNMKIRSPETDYYVQTFEALGANPTPMSMSEIYSAMQTGVVDGQENPIETIVSYGFHNVNKYLIITNHIIKSAYVMINNDFYNSLSEENRKLVLDACAQAREYATAYMDEAIKRDMQTCKDAGVVIIEPDLDEFIAATQVVRDRLGEKAWGKEGYEYIKSIAAGE